MDLDEIRINARDFWLIIAGSGICTVIAQKIFESILGYISNAIAENKKSRLRRSEHIFNSTVNNSLSRISEKDSILRKRQLDALEQIWAETLIIRAQFKILVHICTNVNIEVALSVASQENEDGKNMRNFINLLCDKFGVNIQNKIDKNDKNIEIQKLYVSGKTWSIFYAYRGIMYYMYAAVTLIAQGSESRFLKDPKIIDEILISILPNYPGPKKDDRFLSYAIIVDEVEMMLFNQIKHEMSNKITDDEEIDKTKRILNAVEKLSANVSKVR